MQREVALYKLSNKVLNQFLEKGEIETDCYGSGIRYEDEQVHFFASFSIDDFNTLHNCEFLINDTKKVVSEKQKETALKYLVKRFNEYEAELREQDEEDSFISDLHDYYGVSPHDFININF